MQSAFDGLPDPHPAGLDFQFLLMQNLVGNAEQEQARANLSEYELKLLQGVTLLYNDKLPPEMAKEFLATAGDPAKLQVNRDQQVADLLVSLTNFVEGKMKLVSGAETRDEGMLQLLTIHAENSETAPALAAAALYAVYQSLKTSAPESDEQNVADEILLRYPGSVFAKRLRTSSEIK